MIPYARHYISKNDIQKVTKVLKNQNLTQGNENILLEKKLIQTLKCKYALTLNSSTSSLFLACKALDIQKNDIVWTTPITFVASANCALTLGAKIDFVDIDYNTNNICANKLLEKLKKTKKLPKILIVVHLGGLPCDMKKIKKLSKIYNFKIIEDACHALGAKIDKYPVGSCKYSDITTFSFHAIKTITSGEGGAISTNNIKIYKKIKLLRSHGIKKIRFFRKNKSILINEQITLGYNMRLTEFQAILARNQLNRLGQIMKRKKLISNLYVKKLKKLPITLPKIQPNLKNGYHLFIIKLKNKKKRDLLIKHLYKNKIQTSINYKPLFLNYFYKSKFNKNKFANSMNYYANSLCLPFYYGLKNFEIKKITNKIAELYK